MATAVIQPIEASKTQQRLPVSEWNQFIELISFTDRILRVHCMHRWSFPITSPKKAPVDNQQMATSYSEVHAGRHSMRAFDSHQTCPKCGTERFYNSKTMKPGPMYRRRVRPTHQVHTTA
jgi:hypothetical protein